MKKVVLLFLVSIFSLSSIFAQANDPVKKAEQLMKQKKYAEAVAAYDAAIKLEPKLFNHYFHKSIAETKLKKYDEGKASLKKCLELNAKYCPAYLQLATINRAQKDYAAATLNYEDAMKHETATPKKYQYKLMLVDLLLEKGDISTAKKYTTELTQAAPENLKVIYYAGQVKKAEKDWSGLVNLYEKTSTLESFKKMHPVRQAEYFYDMGVAYLQMKDEANAKKNWSKAYAGEYKDIIAKEKPEWAVEFSEPAMPEDPNNPNPTPTDSHPTKGTTHHSKTTSEDTGGGGGIDWGF
jgi:tetratricopeptide (TPR) repeat protein